MSIFVTNSLQHRSSVTATTSPLTFTHTPSKKRLEWAPTVTEPTAYRKQEFRRILKKFKKAYEKLPEPSNSSTYSIEILNEHKIFHEHAIPSNAVQFMLFGSKGYLPPKEVILNGDDSHLIMEEAWEGPDIGHIQAIGIGYDHDAAASLFIENIMIRNSAVDIEFLAPCFRWFSATRDDGAKFRMIWAYHPDEKTYNARRKNFRFRQPEVSVRKVKNSQVKLKKSFVEHCFSFQMDNTDWHIWKRYDTYKHYNDVLAKRFPELHLDIYFPEKTVLMMKGKTKMLEDREAKLDGWFARLFSSKKQANDPVIKSLVMMPPKDILEGISPLSAAVHHHHSSKHEKHDFRAGSSDSVPVPRRIRKSTAL